MHGARWRTLGAGLGVGVVPGEPSVTLADLGRIVCNSRFLIRPTLRIPQLASHVLGRCLRRLPGDWQARYGEAPVLVETFIDRCRPRGGCYRAANWQYVGDTRGLQRLDDLTMMYRELTRILPARQRPP
ncbi:Druantia anti-phage system protein DruA [Nitrococcus mobilis]|uniref:Uncharacterized protein n=1 Tax=Nitrococcus mobilis Nb-231 TaxID=314278 RepID=A4BLH9_9GAMM|nr:Druantia anti-phage system protein DruA [Nitrococcus mobilis]EAR23167.1 hypothetical protein NB231_15143 [Nitrococcus mobilis Nb-231]